MRLGRDGKTMALEGVQLTLVERCSGRVSDGGGAVGSSSKLQVGTNLRVRRAIYKNWGSSASCLPASMSM